MKNNICLTSILSFALSSSALGQASATAIATWQLSADNGSSWQSGTLTVPLSQESVRARVLIDVDGEGFLGTPHFVQSQMEVYWTSVTFAGLGDTISNVRLLRPFAIGPVLVTTPSRTDRFGSSLKTAGNWPQASPPGTGPTLNAENSVTPTGGVPGVIDPIAIFEYDIRLDGIAGDRSINAMWRGGTYPGVIAGEGAIVVGQFATPTWQLVAAQVTELPATLSVVPAPASFPIFAVGVVWGARRCRRGSF